MKGFLDGVLKVIKWMQMIGGIALTFMITLTTADVILRAFGRPIQGTYEIVAICGGIVIGFTTPFTSWMRGHISVDLLTKKLPEKRRNLFNIITRCVGIGLFLMVSWNVVKIGTSFRIGGRFQIRFNCLCIPLLMA